MLTETEGIELLTLIPEHYEELARFLTAFPGEKQDLVFWRDRFRLWWDENPAFSNDLARGWILRKKGNIVGLMGNLSSLFQLCGKPVIINSGTTWRVLPNYRNYSLRLLHQQMKYSKETLLLGTTPNDTVSRILEIFKFKPLSRSGRKTSLLIIRSNKVAPTLLPKNQLGRLAANFLSFFLNSIQSLRLKISQGPEINVREIFKADSSFDQLWNETKKAYLYTSVRNAKTINWYCFGNGRFKKKLFGIYRKRQLLGYAIFGISTLRGLNTLECLDYWGGFEKSILGSLVHYLKIYTQKNDVDLVRFRSFSNDMDRLFKQLGLFQIKTKKNQEYVRSKLKLEHPLSPENSYFSYMIGDIGV